MSTTPSRLPLVLALAALATCAPPAAAGTLSWEDEAPVAPNRGHHAGGVVEQTIIIAGGGSLGFGGNTSATASRYDPALDLWMPIASLPAPRMFAGGTVAQREVMPGVFEDRLFIGGGMDLSDIVEPVARQTILEYDQTGDTWRTLPSSLPTLSVGGIRMATVGSRIFFLGGYDDIFAGLSDAVFVLDLTDPTESIVPFGDPMPQRLSDGAVAVHGTDVHYIGGYANDYGTFPQSSVHVLDTTTGTWSSVRPAPRGVANAAAATVRDTIYVVGGWDGSGTVFPDVNAYSVLGDTWAADTPLNCLPPGVPGFEGRSGLTLHALDGTPDPILHAVGGSLGIDVENNCHEATPVPPPPVDETVPPEFVGIEDACETSTGGVPRVTLTWPAGTDADNPPVTYVIYRDTALFVPGPGTLLLEDLTETRYDDTDVTCGETYFYIVHARDSAATPNEDANLEFRMVEVTCADPLVPDPSPHLRVSRDADDFPVLDWSAYATPGNVDAFRVRHATDRLAIPGPALDEPAASPYVDLAAVSDPAIPVRYYDVRALQSCGELESAVPGRSP